MLKKREQFKKSTSVFFTKKTRENESQNLEKNNPPHENNSSSKISEMLKTYGTFKNDKLDKEIFESYTLEKYKSKASNNKKEQGKKAKFKSKIINSKKEKKEKIASELFEEQAELQSEAMIILSNKKLQIEELFKDSGGYYFFGKCISGTYPDCVSPVNIVIEENLKMSKIITLEEELQKVIDNETIVITLFTKETLLEQFQIRMKLKETSKKEMTSYEERPTRETIFNFAKIKKPDEVFNVSPTPQQPPSLLQFKG